MLVEVDEQGPDVHATIGATGPTPAGSGDHRLPASDESGTVVAMPYPKKLLNDYEELAVDLHPHWWYFAEAVVGVVVIDRARHPGARPSTGRRRLKWLVLILIVVSAVWLLVRYLKWATTNFVITSDRVIFRHGVFAKSGIEIPLERVNSVHFNQSVFERMIGAGDLLIESGAEGGQQRFTDVNNPDKIQNLIHSQMEQNEARMCKGTSAGRPAVAAGVGDLTTQLERLEGLRDRGTLTPTRSSRRRSSACSASDGASVTSPRPRLVSLVPSATETLLALGADVVACTRFCKQPRSPTVGGTKNPDVAAIVAPGAGLRGRRHRGEPPRGR